MFKSLIVFLSLLSLSAFSSVSEDTCISTKADIVSKIECLDNVVVISSSRAVGSLTIETQFKQPMDHNKKGYKTFPQRVVITHIDESEPMLLQTSGYSIFGVRRAHISRVFNTNQIQVEHRYFKNSIPKNPNWAYLNIKQSASDFHNITVAFKKIYKKSWVNTGASKGGMTSLYHRYFYPDDLDGTVADVAPLSFSTTDQRYNEFLDTVGGLAYKKCRDSLKELQVAMLENSTVFVPSIKGDFDFLGNAALAFEHSVIEAPFYFWQYGSPKKCDSLPNKKDIFEVYDFFSSFANVEGYTNDKIMPYMAYFYQAATELGGPGNLTEHLEELRQHEFLISQYTPKGVDLNYSNNSMRQFRQWALNNADDVMYIYGEFDPWTAGEIPLSITGNNTFKFYVSKGNHSANFTKLNQRDKLKAVTIIGKWLGKSAVSSSKTKKIDSKSLEQLEYEGRSRHKL